MSFGVFPLSSGRLVAGVPYRQARHGYIIGGMPLAERAGG